MASKGWTPDCVKRRRTVSPPSAFGVVVVAVVLRYSMGASSSLLCGRPAGPADGSPDCCSGGKPSPMDRTEPGSSEGLVSEPSGPGAGPKSGSCSTHQL